MYVQCFCLFQMLVSIIWCVVLVPKVRPDDIGGEEMLESINDDVAEVFQNASSIYSSQMCYCKEPLKRIAWNRPFNDWWCLSCFVKQSGRVAFYCNNNSCKFKSVSGWRYDICPSCFEWTDDDNLYEETDEKLDGKQRTFIHRQINHSINMISSDSPYFCVWLTTAFEPMKLI